MGEYAWLTSDGGQFSSFISGACSKPSSSAKTSGNKSLTRGILWGAVQGRRFWWEVGGIICPLLSISERNELSSSLFSSIKLSRYDDFAVACRMRWIRLFISFHVRSFLWSEWICERTWLLEYFDGWAKSDKDMISRESHPKPCRQIDQVSRIKKKYLLCHNHPGPCIFRFIPKISGFWKDVVCVGSTSV